MRPHLRAAVLSTGDEILLGQINDTNGGLISRHLVELGILPVEHAAVGDDLPVLAAAILRLAQTSDLVIMSGGLGPTDGDLTRAALASVLGCDQVNDPAALEWLRAWFAARARALTDRQLRQAERPALARCLRNAFGTAPGLHAVAHINGRDVDIYCLPGPPGELLPMLQAQVLPNLRPPADQTIQTRLLQVIGIGEADAVARMGDLTKRTNMPLVGITASGAVLTIRIRYQGPLSASEAIETLDQTEATIRAALGDMVFARGPTSLHAAILSTLAARSQTLCVVESCTGGLLGELLSEEPGSSRAFVGGWITYSNHLKTSLVGVRPATLDAFGAVSVETAREMAQGGLHKSGAHHALAITGIAGPDGATLDKPVGTICIAHATGNTTDVRRFLITGTRADIRLRAARAALAMLHFHLAGHAAGSPRLLFQSDPAPLNTPPR